MWPELAPIDATLAIESERGVVRIDASGGEFRVDTPTRGIWEIGATLAGVRSVVRLAHEQLALWPSRAQEAALHDVLLACVRHSAAQVPLDVVKDVDAIRRTPLLHAREVLAAPHLLGDAARFRPCRIAIAMIEADDDDDATPERCEALAARLASWRDLYAVDGNAGRALNGTLADHGDALPHEALWGLRRVALTRRAASRAHAELLGLLGAHPRALRLRTHMELVEACGVDELHALIERAPVDARTLAIAGIDVNPTDPAVAVLAELVASCSVPVANNVRLRDVYGSALHYHVEQVPPSTKTARPPIPLPGVTGIRFLETVDDLIMEGWRMAHCVATRRGAAVAGESFMFAIDDADGGQATVQMDNHGRVVEARGPKNRENSTAAWARRALTRWGRGFWAARIGLTEKTWHHSVLPPLCVPLWTVEDCYRQYARAANAVPDDDGALAAWFTEWCARAVKAEVGLACDPRPSTKPFVYAVSASGDIVARSDDHQSEKMM